MQITRFAMFEIVVILIKDRESKIRRRSRSRANYAFARSIVILLWHVSHAFRMQDRVLAASYVKQTPSRYKGELRTKDCDTSNAAACIESHTMWFAYEFEKSSGSRREADVDDDDDDEGSAIRVAGRECHVIRGWHSGSTVDN